MALQDETWQWDEADAVASTSESLARDVDGDLMMATGAGTARRAHDLFVGHLRLGEEGREGSVQLQFKAPRSMAQFVDEQREELQTDTLAETGCSAYSWTKLMAEQVRAMRDLYRAGSLPVAR